MKKWIALSWSQPSRPAMLGEASAQLGTGTVEANVSLVPCNHFPGTYSPFSFIGVWHSPHCPITFTRYSPWAICCLLAVLAGAATLLRAATMHNAPTTIAIINFFTFCSLSLLVVIGTKIGQILPQTGCECQSP